MTAMATTCCPICGHSLDAVRPCPRCGWDLSADPELFPTLFSEAGDPLREARVLEARRKAAEAEREELYLRFCRTVFAGVDTEALRECAEAEEAEEGIRRLMALLGMEAPKPQPPAEQAGPEYPWSNEPTIRPEPEYPPVGSAPGVRELAELLGQGSPMNGDAAPETRELLPGLDLPVPRAPEVPSFSPVPETRRNGSGVLRPAGLLLSAMDRGRIQAVRFQDSLRNLPPDHWDASAARDGSVLACLRQEAGLLTLLICSENGVWAPEDCSSLFLDLRQLRSVDFANAFHTEDCTDMSSMFYGCRSLQTVDLSGLDASRVTDMTGMFCSCAALEQVYLPNGINALYPHMFEHCTALRGLIVPDTVCRIGDHAFFDCPVLAELALPEAVTAIGRNAFKNCIGLKKLALPARVERLENGVFMGCIGLEELLLPAALTGIGDNALWGCGRLAELRLPPFTEEIGRFAFKGCRSLRSLVLPRKMTCIESGVFTDCSALAEVVIPAGVTRICRDAFPGCSALRTVYFVGSADQWRSAVEKPNDELDKALVQYSL